MRNRNYAKSGKPSVARGQMPIKPQRARAVLDRMGAASATPLIPPGFPAGINFVKAVTVTRYPRAHPVPLSMRLPLSSDKYLSRRSGVPSARHRQAL